jgi:2'-5' RNA ligase
VRLFIGIPLAPNAAEALLRIRQQFASISTDLRWSSPESWHVTLQFLGSTDAQQQACVVANLATLSAASFSIRIAGLGFFERVGVFYAGIVLAPELLALQQRITAATRPCGFIPEARPYHPHITLARSKGGKALAPLKQALDRGKVAVDEEFTAEEFLLDESFLGPEGSRYEVRARFPLCA